MTSCLSELMGGASPLALAYRPFLDPLDLHAQWFWTLIPLLLLVSCAYKGIRLRDLRRWPMQSLLMTFQLILLMAGLAVALHVGIEFVLPLFVGG